jgi:quercetin dioxygenase-like cupin family protein
MSKEGRAGSETPRHLLGYSFDTLTHVKEHSPAVGYRFNMNEQPLIASGSEKVVSLPEETRFAPNGIVSRTLLRTENSRVVLFGFAAGQELTEHKSTQHATVQILSGQCDFFLSGKPHALKPGDLLYMPPNCPHALKATSEMAMLLTLSKPEKN